MHRLFRSNHQDPAVLPTHDIDIHRLSDGPFRKGPTDVIHALNL